MIKFRKIVSSAVVAGAMLASILSGPVLAANILFVTTNNGSLTSPEAARKTQMEGWGFTVNTIWDGASQATFNTAFGNNAAVYMSDEVSSSDIGEKLREAPIGVASEDLAMADNMGFCSSAATTTSSSTVTITSTPHYITSPYATGSFTLGSTSYPVNRMAGTTAPGGIVLATVGGVNSIVAVETGATLANSYNGSSLAFGRRIQLPIQVSTVDPSTFSANLIAMSRRMVNWAAGIEQELVAHWKLDESSGTSAADATGMSHTGTVTGTTSWTTGVLNNGFQFNGSTRIQATGLLGGPTSFTLAAWAKLTAVDSGGSEIISLGDRVFLRLDESGATKASFYNGSSFVTVSISQAFTGADWHHFAATFDNATDSFKLYVDGVQAASITTTSTISYSGGGSNTVIGRQGNAGTSNDFTGTIDDVRVYNYAISATEVAELYGFIGHWKLNQTSGTTANDSTIFAKNATLTGTASWSSDCGGGGVFDFNGSTHYFSTTNASHLQPTERLTIAAWVKGDSWGAGSDVDVILRKGEANPNNYQLDISDGRVELVLDGNDGAGIRSTATLTTGVWYHVAATWDGTTARIYINGTLDSSTARSGTIATDTRPVYIGGRSGADLFDGMVRDVRLYNRALSGTEVQKLAGLVAHWAFSEGSGTTAADTSGQGLGVTLSGATWTTSCSGEPAIATNGAGGIAQTTAPFTPPDTGTVAFWMQSSGTPASIGRIFGLGGDWEMRQMTDGKVIADLGADGSTFIGTTPLTVSGQWYHVAASYDSGNNGYAIYVDGVLQLSGTYGSSVDQQPAAVLSFGTRTGSTEYWQGALRDFRVYNRRLCPLEIAGLAGLGYNWKLDQTSGTVATDSSSFGSHGTYVNGVTLNQSGPRPGYVAAQFDGTNDYVDLPDDSQDYSNGFSVSVWARPTSAGFWARFIDFGNGATSNNIYFGRQTTGTTLEFAIYSGGGGTTYKYVRASNAIVLNEWHQYAATVSAAGVAKLYRDGVELSVTSGSAGYPTIGLPNNVTRTTNYIGRSNWGGDAYYQGKMWDVHVYNRCLCPTEVQSLYTAGIFPGVRIIKWVEIQ